MQIKAVDTTLRFLGFRFLQKNGTIREWSTIGSGIGGGPVIPMTFSKFGSSITTLGDFDGDGLNDMIVSESWGNLRLYLNKSGKFIEHSESWGLSKYNGHWNKT